MIKLQKYQLSNNITLTNQILSSYVNSFWEDIYSSIENSSNKHLLLLCRIQYSDSELGYKTLGHLRKVNYSDRLNYLEYLQERLGLVVDAYTSHPISQISFSYIIKEGLLVDGFLQQTPVAKTTQRFHNLNIPISMVPSEYGTIITKEVIANFTRYVTTLNNKVFQIDVSNDGNTNKVTIIGASNLKWVDTRLNEGAGFMRVMGKSTYYYLGGELVLRKVQLAAKAFKKLSADRLLNTRFITMDIETINQLDGGERIKLPYLICGYNGSEYITSYSKDQKQLFGSFLDQLLLRVKAGSTTLIYAHNLSGFDGIFLLKHLLAYGQVKPLLFNGKLMSIKVKITGKTKSESKVLVFKDSMLLLPLSLRKLCSSFNVSKPKGYFPYELTNIFYTGVLPKFEHWSGITVGEYGTLRDQWRRKMWSFQQEAIKYCKLDCQLLHEILTKFTKLIFNEFKIDAHKALTLPALSMRIYKTHYMPDNTIYQILGRPEVNIRESYSGGAVDVYKPHNRVTEFFSLAKAVFRKLYYYDVNSLYPFVMARNDMPIGKPVAFEGDIRKIDPQAFGYFFCEINSPDNLPHPILQRRIKTNQGLRTVAGLGSWKGWIFSAEMDNAKAFGYEFKILNGYQFERGNIFLEYIEKLYNLRLQYEKGTSMNLIAKLLMNSLYGKFAMRMEVTKVEIFDVSTVEGMEEFIEMAEIWGESIQDHVNLGNHYVIVRDTTIDLLYNQDQDMYHGQDVNIAIGAAITARARVHMSFFKNNPLFNLYYSDTDSAVIDAPLPPAMVGNGLGQMKLEHIIDKAVFLAPKVYGLVTHDGSEVIKIKGVTSEALKTVNFAILESLLKKDSNKDLLQVKWYKEVISGNISEADVAYTLKSTSNKRAPIYDNYGFYCDTRPYLYKEITIK